MRLRRPLREEAVTTLQRAFSQLPNVSGLERELTYSRPLDRYVVAPKLDRSVPNNQTDDRDNRNDPKYLFHRGSSVFHTPGLI